MTTDQSFEHMLTGGHPNSLGRTIEVVDLIFADPARLEELYQCYFSADEVVRLRVSNAFKRIARAQPTWFLPYVDRFLGEIAHIRQASTQWTLAQLFSESDGWLTPAQRAAAIEIVKRNLTSWDDWIVLNQSLEALAHWARADAELRAWLKSQAERLAQDPRKSVAKKASQVLKQVSKTV